MNQQANPLDQLRDIHLPEPVTGFELAPGWWFIIGVLLITLIVYCFNYYKKKKRLAILKPIAQEFSQLELQNADVQALAKLNEILKRVVLIFYPATRVANLTGDAWIKFLNTHSTDHQISNDESLWLTQGAYQKAISINQADWKNLVNKCHQILVQLVIKQTLSKPARIKS